MTEAVLPVDFDVAAAGEAGLNAWIESIEQAVDRLDSGVQSLVPEPGRSERLLTEVKSLLARTSGGNPRPPLFGIPVGVKDIFHAAGLPTRAGSSLPPEVLQGNEGWAVRRLREAGALVLGKTVTTEFAFFSPGPTRNPRNLAHTPGGSSSGSAAAVALGLCPLTLGTQTIGSVIRPAAFCGVIGFKPSFGRIPASGVIPLAPSLDHVGFFARDPGLVETAAAVLIRGWNPAADRRRPRIGVPEGPYLEAASVDGLKNFYGNISLLEEAGYQVKRIPVFHGFDEIVRRHYLITSGEAAQVHRTWFQAYAAEYHPKTRELIERGRQVRREELVHARSQRTVLRRDLSDLMNGQEIDCWITPSAVGAAPAGLDSTGDPVMNLPWTQAGMPAISLPSGASPEGLPYGLQIVARFGEDELLVAWAMELAKVVEPNP